MTLPSWSHLTRIVATMDLLYRLTYFLRMIFLAFVRPEYMVHLLGTWGVWIFFREAVKFLEGSFWLYIYYASFTFAIFSNLGLCVLAYLLRDATDPNEDNGNWGSVRSAQAWFFFNILAIINEAWAEYQFNVKFPQTKLYQGRTPKPLIIYTELSISVLWFVYRLASLIIVFEFARELQRILTTNRPHEQLMQNNSLNNVFWDVNQSVELQSMRRNLEKENTNPTSSEVGHDKQQRPSRTDLENPRLPDTS